MTTLRHLGTAAATITLALAAACAQDGDPAPGTGDVSYDPDEVVIRVEYTGGFLTPELLATRLPLLTVYGDGRVITEGPQIMIYPGPALPNLQVQRISPEDVAALVERALDAGVGSGLDYGDPPIADAAATRFTVQTQIGYQTTEVYALDDVPGAGLSEEQTAARASLRGLLADLTNLPATLGGDAVTEEGPYQPTALAAVAEPWTAPEEAELGEQAELTWPGPQLPGEVLNPQVGLHCVTVTGDDAAASLAAASEANVLTPWRSGDQRWRVTLRPLLPDEADCDDLQP